MKFQLTFKTPDAVETAVQQEMANRLGDCPDCGPKVGRYCVYCERIADAAYEDAQLMRKVAAKFVQHDETITVEFDTDTGRATVVPAPEKV